MAPTKVFASITVAAIVSGGGALAATAQTQAERGAEVFRSVGCWECHGTVGQGGVGPKLAPNPLPAAAILAIVRKPIKEMPPYHPRILSDADVVAIGAYLATIKPAPAVDTLDQLTARSQR